MLGKVRHRRGGGHKLHLVIEPDETGTYVAHVVELPGCVSQGTSYRDAFDNMLLALQGYLAVQIRRQGEQVSESALLGTHSDRTEIELALA
jgi:predicted RNase H-like HicB family nuclease